MFNVNCSLRTWVCEPAGDTSRSYQQFAIKVSHKKTWTQTDHTNDCKQTQNHDGDAKRLQRAREYPQRNLHWCIINNHKGRQDALKRATDTKLQEKKDKTTIAYRQVQRDMKLLQCNTKTTAERHRTSAKRLNHHKTKQNIYSWKGFNTVTLKYDTKMIQPQRTCCISLRQRHLILALHKSHVCENTY